MSNECSDKSHQHDTPITDANVVRGFDALRMTKDEEQWVRADVARQLERDLAEVTDVCDIEIRQRMKLERELAEAIGWKNLYWGRVEAEKIAATNVALSSTAAQECKTANAHDLYLVSSAWFKYVREEISADVLFAFMKEAAENYRDRFNGLAPSATSFAKGDPTPKTDALLKRQEAQRRDINVSDFAELARLHEQERVLLMYELERERNDIQREGKT